MAGRSQRHKLDLQNVDSSGRSVPTTSARPTFTGTNTVGSLQTGVNATFVGTGTITVTRAWVRDNVEIAGQTGATYTLVAGDSGKAIRFRNKASNAVSSNLNRGSTIVDSLPRTVP
jgi:alpha-D-ribose 1-methylphosphonate 5-triphosphate synthase subunit PhnG